MAQMNEHNPIPTLAVAKMLQGAGIECNAETVFRELEEQGWTIYPVFHQGNVIGAIIEQEGEIHTSIAPSYQKLWNPRPYIKNILYPALETYGEIRSHAKKEDIKAIRWLTKLGFESKTQDDENIYFVLTRKKY
jgi:hypothetical protein